MNTGAEFESEPHEGFSFFKREETIESKIFEMLTGDEITKRGNED